MSNQCPFCGTYSLTYDWRLNAFICHIYNATINAEVIPKSSTNAYFSANPTKENTMMRFTRRPRAATRPLADIIAEAQRELATNPTIMVSTFDEHGVEHRRRGNAWAGLTAGFRDMGEAFERFNASVERAAESCRQIVAAATKCKSQV